MAKKAKKAKKTKAKAKPVKKAKRAVKRTVGGLRIMSVTATANLMPPGPQHFYVRAKVEVPTPGYTASLKKAVPQGINPAILILDVVTKAKPGIWPQHVAVVDANYDDKNYKGNYKQVTVRYGSQSKTVNVQIVV